MAEQETFSCANTATATTWNLPELPNLAEWHGDTSFSSEVQSRQSIEGFDNIENIELSPDSVFLSDCNFLNISDCIDTSVFRDANSNLDDEDSWDFVPPSLNSGELSSAGCVSPNTPANVNTFCLSPISLSSSDLTPLAFSNLFIAGQVGCSQMQATELPDSPTSQLWNRLPSLNQSSTPLNRKRPRRSPSGLKKQRRKIEKPEVCKYCHKGHAQWRELVRHYISNHKHRAAAELGISTKRIPCPYCTKDFARNDHLTRHVKNIHE